MSRISSDWRCSLSASSRTCSSGRAGRLSIVSTFSTYQPRPPRAGVAIAPDCAAKAACATAAEALSALLDDPAAAPAVAELCNRYACAIASVVALLDPARVVLAGKLARLGGERLRGEIARQLTAILPAAPQLTLTVATDTPILDGAMLMSLGIARDRVFTT